jgi:hypothetical protein
VKRAPFLVTLLTALCAAPTVSRATVVEPVLRSGAPVPGRPGTFVSEVPFISGSISRNGVVVAGATFLSESGRLENFVMSYGDGQAQVLVNGEDAYDAEGNPVRPDPWEWPVISPNGRYVAAAVGIARPGGEDRQHDVLLWDLHGDPTQPAFVFQDATGSHLGPANVRRLAVTDSGAFSATIVHGGRPHVYAGNATSVGLIAGYGTPLPGHGLPAENVTSLGTSPGGLTLFGATTDFNSGGVYVGSSTGIQRVAARNDPAPGMADAWFAEIYTADGGIGDDGRAAFRAAVVGPGKTSASDEGIWVGLSAASLTLVAQEGARAPGEARDFTGFGSTTINGPGQVAFTAALGPSPDVNSLWLSDPSNTTLTKVAETGDPAPGTGTTFGDIGNYSLSDTGLVAFQARVPPQSPFAPYATGLWVGRPGDVRLLLLTGQPFQLDGAWVTLDAIALSDWTPSAITDDGRVLAQIAYHDPAAGGNASTLALVILSVPEPGCTLLPPLAVHLLAARRRRKSIAP